MNALTEFSIVVICVVIANTTANRLTDGSLPIEEYGNDDGKLRQQLEQNKHLFASLQTQIQQLEDHQEEMQEQLAGHKDEMKQRLDAHQRELNDQKHELVKVVRALLMGRKDANLDGAMHHISKREVPSDAYPINNAEELLNLLLESGVTGPPGKDGKGGEAGRDGQAGRDGAPGRDGTDGNDGDPGRDGYNGKDGEVGKSGEDGRDGMNGKDGENGKDGVDGDNGHNALDGAPGPPGPAGPAGPTGFPGINGTVGPQGRRGPPGADGEVGKDGVDGANGHNALDGAPGPPGVSGNNGTVGLQGPRGLPGADNTADVNAGAVYTRWGRTTCSSNSTLVYKGFAGSSNYDTTGGGTNYQCLTTEPEYNQYSGEQSNWMGSLMAGAEYKDHDLGVFPDTPHNDNVPCARCYTRNRAAVMMIPAKRTCPDDWTKEYEGYLMAEKDLHAHPSTFECVDGNPESIPGLNGYSAGALFYFVKTDCSGIHTTGHCPPYIGNRELTCVVCTQ